MLQLVKVCAMMLSEGGILFRDNMHMSSCTSMYSSYNSKGACRCVLCCDTVSYQAQQQFKLTLRLNEFDMFVTGSSLYAYHPL